MPSKDPVNPKANEWMSSDQGKRSATVRAERGATDSRTVRRDMSAQLLRLARRTGSDPEELVKKIPADTLRRTKYPVLETVSEDGKRSFKHDLGIDERRRAL